MAFVLPGEPLVLRPASFDDVHHHTRTPDPKVKLGDVLRHAPLVLVRYVRPDGTETMRFGPVLRHLWSEEHLCVVTASPAGTVDVRRDTITHLWRVDVRDYAAALESQPRVWVRSRGKSVEGQVVRVNRTSAEVEFTTRSTRAVSTTVRRYHIAEITPVHVGELRFG